MEKIEYHLYEVLRNGLNVEGLSFSDDKNWTLIDLSNKEKIRIQSGKRIDNLLAEKGINYTYQGLKSCERKEIEII